MNNDLTFGQWLKRRRRGLGLTQRALGERASYASETIRKVEADELRPSVQLAEKLAEALEIEPVERTSFLQFAREGVYAADAVPSTQTATLVAGGIGARGSEMPRHNLRAALTSFIGREQVVAEVQQLLGEQRLVTITGPGGMGKSRLALAIAAGLVAAFTDGVWLVELAPLADSSGVPEAVGRTLGVSEVVSQPALAALTAHLRSRALLLVLDNCEHVLSACSHLAEHLLANAPELRLLATSREALGVAGEALFRVPALNLPDPRHLPPTSQLTDYEAPRLFVERVRAVEPAFALSDTNVPAIADICHQLDGMPLAIELAAARGRTLSPEQIADRLSDRFRLLTTGSRTALPRHQTLRATVEWSHALLSDAERVLFRRLAVFAGGWTLEAAEAVCAEAGQEASTLDLLGGLVSKSIVGAQPAGAEVRFTLLETLRQYAYEKLAAAGELEALRTRHLVHFLALAETAATYMRGPQQVVWVRRLDADYPNLLAALDFAVSQEHPTVPEAGLRLVVGLARYWMNRAYYYQAHTWLERSLAQGKPVPSPVRARALYHLAGFTANHNETPVRQIQEQSLAMAEAVGDKFTAALTLMFLGYQPESEAQGEAPSPGHARALALFEDLGDLWGQANTLNHMAQMQLRLGHNRRAEGLMRQSLHLNQQVDDPAMVSHNLSFLAHINLLLGDLVQAKRWIDEAFGMAHRSTNYEVAIFNLHNAGQIALRQADYAYADDCYKEHEAIHAERGDNMYVWWAQTWRGIIAAWQGDLDRALRLQTTALDSLRTLGQATRLMSMRAQWFLGVTHLLAGDAALANALIEEAVTYFREAAMKPDLSLALCWLGRVRYHQGEGNLAGRLFQEALELAQTADNARVTALAHDGLGRLALAQNHHTRAWSHLSESYALSQHMGARREMAETLEALGALALAQIQPQPAATLLGAASALRRTIGAPVPPVERAEHKRVTRAVCEALGEAGFAAEYQAGADGGAEPALALIGRR